MSVTIGKSPREAFLERRIELLEAELAHYKGYSMQSYSLVSEPAPTIEVDRDTEVLRLAAAGGVREDAMSYHVFANYRWREKESGYTCGYYVSKPQILRHYDKMSVLSELLTQATHRLVQMSGD